MKYQGAAGQTLAATNDALPISVDGQNTWLQGMSGNGVFQTQVGAANTGTGVIDAGSVTDPTAITGAAYSVQFAQSGGNPTYSVLKNGAATSLTNVNYSSGKAIQIDGMSFTITGQPANGDTFSTVPSTPTNSVFDALQNAADALATPNRTSSEITQQNNFALSNIDAVAAKVSAARSDAGATLQRIDFTTARITQTTQNAQTIASNATDVDMTKAISSFQAMQTGYSAALQAYGQMQRLTLFEYMPTN